MGKIAKEVSGQTFCFIGLIGLCVTCGLPMWRTTYFIGANIVTGQIVWDGLWMNCVMQSTGQMQCKIQSSIMSLTQDLKAAQALIVIAILIAFAGVLMTFIGGRCTSCLKNESSMAKVVIFGGILCIVAAVVCLIPVCWSAAFTIIDYDNVLVPTSQKREIGACIYIGWGTTFMLGFGLGIVGFLGTIIVCALPMWRVTAFIGANIVTAQIIWEGLWMTCVIQSTGQMQCKIYDSMLALPQDLQAARALIIISIIVCLFAMVLGISGGKCTNFVEKETTKIKVAIASGVTFIIAGVLCLIPVCWSTNSVVQDFYNPIITSAQKRELGASIYIGFGTAALLLLGGALLCSSCPPQEEKNYNNGYKYSQPRSVATSRAYV
ncbi:claudin-like protein ZF-A89 [Tachysurus fulvidraco]|uniref:claudin-like protein ZF-A89 n=1 Tax=Tachysurus fulvidraco TaxID=1234273 RepID=UPI001FEEF3A1|nr:claudin-like protein ZF-A89 [Tachysurus fulvidraco]